MRFGFSKLVLFVSLGLFLLQPACKEDEVQPNEKVRLFRPVEVTASFDGTTVEINWLPIKGAQSYSLDLSKDSLQFENIVKTINNITESSVVIPELAGGSRYSVRIIAIADQEQYNSKYAEETFVTPTENILYQIDSENIGANDVIVKWDPSKTVTRIVVTSASGSPLEFQVSDAEKNAGEKLLEGLTGETSYLVEIYNAEIQRGAVPFKTLIDIEGATIINPEDDLREIMTTAGGGYFVLMPGEYLVSSGAITLTSNTVVKAFNAASKPVIHVLMDIDGSGSYVFENIEFSGFTIDEESGELSQETRESYVLRINENTTADAVTLNGCIVKNYDRSLIRGTSGGSVDVVTINDCIVEDVTSGNNEFLDFRSCAVNEINITNSTFSKSSNTRHFLRCDDIAGLEGQIINIENCTFYQVATPANRLVYIRTLGNKVTVKNCVFSEMADAEYRIDDPATGFPVIDYNYYHQSPVLAASEFNGPNIIVENDESPFSGNPEEGNFTIDFNSPIRNSGEGNSAMGDPRWVF